MEMLEVGIEEVMQMASFKVSCTGHENLRLVR